MRAYMQGRLSEQGTWNATQLAESLREEFSVSVTPEAVRQHLLAMDYTCKRTRYAPSREPDLGEEKEAREGLERLKDGPPKGRSPQKYLDVSGFSLCLPPTSCWTQKGRAHQHRDPKRGGRKDA